MAQDLVTLRARLERLEELSRHAEPEDQARLKYTIHLVAAAIEAVKQAKWTVLLIQQQQAVSESDVLRWRYEVAALMSEMQIINDETRTLEELYSMDGRSPK
jgi:DNA-binding transcriptional regulator YbjK